MDMPTFNTVWPVASFILGATLAQANASLSEKRQRDRERESREYESRRKILEGKKSFEVEVLNDLHKSLISLRESADSLTRWHGTDEADRSVSEAEEICVRMRIEMDNFWRLDGLLFDPNLSRFLSGRVGIALFPDGGTVIPSRQALEGYGDSVWDAHSAVAQRLKELYDAVRD
ncbi:hypothetical protein [Streptomyces sp. NPDC088794]|uniref:hypothetical protein n=1 Tax=Streptomyces sp. NPDC088794 TaxID=3365902 RepID=UPI00380C59B9